MPYSGVEDERLPQPVKEMPADDRKQWVATFNKFFADCVDDGGSEDSCEQQAFGVAYAAVERASTFLQTIYDAALKFTDFVSKSVTHRSISIDEVFWQVSDQVWEMEEMTFLTNVYFDNDEVFGVFARGGKLYRSPITVSGTDVAIGDLVEVQMEFEEVPRSKLTLRQSDNGEWRWIAVSAASVLNRVGEIDSTDMFDSFVEHALETGEYPIRQFYHAGEQFRTGQCDFIARDGNLLVTSGVYDDTELGRGEVKARLADPDFWGDSIGFIPSGEPDVLEFENDIEIPVYRCGALREISTVPEASAASFLTAMPTLETEVNRMLNEKQFEQFVKLFEGDEDKARKWLEENTDTRNRTILNEGMISRDNTPDADATNEQEDVDTTERDADADPDTTEAPEGEEIDGEENDFVFELDEEATAAIAERVSTGLTDTVTELLTPLQEAVTAATETIAAMAERITTLEESEQKRHQRWMEDIPRGRLTVTHRPSVDRADQPDEIEEEDDDEDEVSSADVALDKISQLN
jgi:cation transport regulator ChaB